MDDRDIQKTFTAALGRTLNIDDEWTVVDERKHLYARIEELERERDEAIRQRDTMFKSTADGITRLAEERDRLLRHLTAGAETINEHKARAEAAEAEVARLSALLGVPADFAMLIAQARVDAENAMRKFPQPNYVISKIAEEAGEVVKAAIHCAEGRETVENLRGEMKQTIAMLYRLWVEGDGVHGLQSVRALLARLEAREVSRTTGCAACAAVGMMHCSDPVNCGNMKPREVSHDQAP